MRLLSVLCKQTVGVSSCPEYEHNSREWIIFSCSAEPSSRIILQHFGPFIGEIRSSWINSERKCHLMSIHAKILCSFSMTVLKLHSFAVFSDGINLERFPNWCRLRHMIKKLSIFCIQARWKDLVKVPIYSWTASTMPHPITQNKTKFMCATNRLQQKKCYGNL